MNSKSSQPVEIELWKHRLANVAREMGIVLRRSSYSSNIKERRDFSTAIFDGDTRMLAQGDDIPVHLGSMPMSVRAALENTDLGPGDTVILNDPYLGGTHLPDMTLVSPVYFGSRRQAVFFVANRAHHSDVGGMSPGSMPLAREIYQEGLRIPPVRIVRGGVMDDEIVRLILANVRTPEERMGDLRAQIAANKLGAQRMQRLLKQHGIAALRRMCSMLLDYTARVMRSLIREIPNGHYGARDFLDDDGFGRLDIPIEVQIVVRNESVQVDFSKSSAQVPGGMNAVEAITRSAVFYVFRSLLREAIPSNDGCMRPIRLTVPAASVVAARSPSAVAGGNVETAQRLVDVLFAALQPALPHRIPASSCGSMNNITIGGEGADGKPYTYYETIGGGMGARPNKPGLSAVHTHMTNSLNTPIEALHHQYPFRIVRYAIRRRSAGSGRFRGGDGLLREYAFDLPARVSVISERRRHAPPGAAGGGSARPGRNSIFQRGRWKTLPGKFEIEVNAGDRLRIETPGGGGWGALATG